MIICLEVAGGGEQKPGTKSERYLGDEAPPQADWKSAVYSRVSDGILGKTGEEHLGPLRWKRGMGKLLLLPADFQSWYFFLADLVDSISSSNMYILYITHGE